MLLADVGLRYDQTVPLARVYAAYQAKLPPVFKSFQIQPVWRADTPGKGRFREFYQCDVDVVGSSSLSAEVELGAVASECLTRLGFESFNIRINHRVLLRAIVQLADVPETLEAEAITAIDKSDRLGIPGVEAELEKRGVDKQARMSLLSLVGERPSLERIKRHVAGHAPGRQAVEEVEAVLSLSEVTPAARRFAFDVSLARGLDYYTGCIFEAAAPNLAVSLGGGGRYDNLIGMFMNRRAPACGFSLGLERILVAMEEGGLFPESLDHLDLVVAACRQQEQRAAIELAAKLRSADRRVELTLNAMQPGKLRKYADERRIPMAVWLEPGESERASLWTRADGSIQTGLSFDQIILLLTRRAQAV